MSLKIYFCGSIRAGRQDVDLYGRLVSKLGDYGKVLTPFVADPKVTALGTVEGGCSSDSEIYERDMRLLGECDAVVAECTVPSHGVGYEIGRAMAMKKKTLCIFRPQEGKSEWIFRELHNFALN